MRKLLSMRFFLSLIFFITSYQVVADNYIQDDVIVRGSLCVGLDCVNGENFNFDTIRMKENNVRIRFIDTSSSSSFPSRDWELGANESTNGGLNNFYIMNVDNNTIPFNIIDGAPNSSLFINSGGWVGFNTSAPAMNLHVVYSNTPTLRLEQNQAAGFSAQAWDVGGNETNFFVRDVTTNGQLPFRISKGATSGALFIAADGDIGFETTTPDGQLDIAHVSNVNNHAVLVSPLSYFGINIDNGFNPRGWLDVQTTGGVSRLLVQTDGNVGIGMGTSGTVSGRFEVKSLDSTKTYFDIDAEGDIGIGTPTITDRLEIKNRENTATILNLSNTGQLGLNTNTFTNHAGIVPLFVLEGSSGTDQNAIVINAPNSWSSSFIFSKADTAMWTISARNDAPGDVGGLYFYDQGFGHILTLAQTAQGGGIGIGVELPASGRLIDTSSGAYLSTAGVWTDMSSRAAKQDIEDISIEAAQETLQQLNPVTYVYKKQPEETHAGFIAEDVPEMVATFDRKGLAPMDIVAVLTKVVQQQQKSIEELTSRLKQMESSK